MFAPGHIDVCTEANSFVAENFAVSQKQIKQIVVDEIMSGHAKPGDKVPSIRMLSAKFAVSQAIIRRAFSQLLAEGWLEMRHGSGTYVSDASKVLIPNNGGCDKFTSMVRMSNNYPSNNHNDHQHDHQHDHAQHSGIPGVPEVVDDHSVFRPTRWKTELQNTFDGRLIYGLTVGKNEIDFLPGSRSCNLPRGARWDVAIDKWKSDCARMPGLTDPAGMLELRHEIADWLRRAKGMTCTMNDIIVVNGAQEARSLLARLLIDRGTRLVFEEPGSVANRMLFQSYGAEMVPVSIDESGLVVDELASVTEASLLYVTPVAQFPTGAVFSRARKQRIAEWATERNAIVIEDESASEFIYESRISPPIAAMAAVPGAAHDAARRTVYIGSFSQMLPPEWQIGFIVAPPAFRVPLLRAKSMTNRCTSFLVQSLTRRLLESGFVQDYIRRVQRQNDERRASMLEHLQQWTDDNVAFSPVKGGCSQTIWLTPGVDDLAVVRACAESGIAVTPVSPCFMRQPSQSGLILNFSAIDVDDIGSAMRRLSAVLQTFSGGR